MWRRRYKLYINYSFFTFIFHLNSSVKNQPILLTFTRGSLIWQHYVKQRHPDVDGKGRNLKSYKIEIIESIARKISRFLHPWLDQQFCDQWLKWSCEAGGGRGLTWRSQVGANPIPIPGHAINLALFGHKITLYRFNQGVILLLGAQIVAGGSAPLAHSL